MTSEELRKRFLKFFKERGHTVVPSSSLLPDDPSVLLTTAGMQQFKPYYTGAADPLQSPHPTLDGKPLGSKNAASVQKSFRTSDIDEVGDERHLTFFEMLGNFSFGGYFKKEAIEYAYEFITKEMCLKIEYVSVFGGEPFDSAQGKSAIPADLESERVWKGIDPNLVVKQFGRADNFWGPTGSEGPCGPSTEIYVDGIEIWNVVFNQYYQHKDGNLEPLKIQGVDTGMGLERLAMVSQGKKHIFETDLFQSLIDLLPVDMEEKKKRVLADHARGIAFLLSDRVTPSNKEAGYVLRRLMRRAIVYYGDLKPLLKKVVDMYHSFYPELNTEVVVSEFEKEYEKFNKSVKIGLRELEKTSNIDSITAFNLYQSYGLPYEIIKEFGQVRAQHLTRDNFQKELVKHQEISRAGKERKFGGHGLLLDTGELKAANEEELKIVTRLHTATHLLQASLRKILGEHVHQEGSDITAERTRFDFNFDRKLTPEEIEKVEDYINEMVEKNLDMSFELMPFEQAVQSGALYSKKEKYPATVKIYTAQDSKTREVFSKEFCGGPHVLHTAEVGKVKIVKEESVSSGIRRIRATVE